MRSLQEKFQISSNPPKDEPPEQWASFESARQPQNNPKSWCPKTADDVDMRRFNKMPADMDIPKEFSEQHRQPFSMGGQTDVSKDYNKESIENGFKRVAMSGSDDQYNGEHTDLFYGDTGGFIERNNYLDRM